jgi:hypothetical protein
MYKYIIWISVYHLMYGKNLPLETDEHRIDVG